MEFTAPKIEYAKILPLLIVFGVAIVSVLVEAFLPRRYRYVVQVTLSIVTLVAALVATIGLAGSKVLAAEGAIAVDGFTLFLWGTILVLSLVSVLLLSERAVDGGVTAFADRRPHCPAPRPSARPRPGGSSRPRCSRCSSSRWAACCCSRRRATC